MSNSKIMEQAMLIDRVNRYTESGWRFEPDANRVRVHPPENIRELFGLSDRASWIVGASYEEALGFADGFSEAAWLAKWLAKNRG